MSHPLVLVMGRVCALPKMSMWYYLEPVSMGPGAVRTVLILFSKWCAGCQGCGLEDGGEGQEVL